MADVRSSSLRRLGLSMLPVFFVTALLVGCGGGDKANTVITPGEGEKKATNSMEEFMKKGNPGAPNAKK